MRLVVTLAKTNDQVSYEHGDVNTVHQVQPTQKIKITPPAKEKEGRKAWRILWQ
jgi:hypothetical protein